MLLAISAMFAFGDDTFSCSCEYVTSYSLVYSNLFKSNIIPCQIQSLYTYNFVGYSFEVVRKP